MSNSGIFLFMLPPRAFLGLQSLTVNSARTLQSLPSRLQIVQLQLLMAPLHLLCK